MCKALIPIPSINLAPKNSNIMQLICQELMRTNNPPASSRVNYVNQKLAKNLSSISLLNCGIIYLMISKVVLLLIFSRRSTKNS